MEVCYEYLGCSKTDCIMHGRKDGVPCWEVENTLCNHHGIELVRRKTEGRKEDACRRAGCIYYKVARRRR